ncbi:uncharacterized protein LOC143295415 [Babylonia areolata]|uniref:uncharacterized protein LOC143295415 n=1 Tax=Babylonia areolata TaxID=304850 RepID=UPI003FCFE639
MLPTPAQIKEKLLTQLDDKNEVDEPMVVEVLADMESYPFTRTVLEETRIGKMANDLRRKVKNQSLAKRLKQLLRSWQCLTNGTPTQMAGKLGISPVVSPSPKAFHASPRVPCPPLQKGMPKAPTQSTQPSVSPAINSSKSGAIVGRRGTSIPPSPLSLEPQKLVSPASVGCHKVPLGKKWSSSGDVVSPKVSSQVPSPVVPPHVSPRMMMQTSTISPSLLQTSTASPRMMQTPTTAGSSHGASPALRKVREKSRPLMKPSPIQSPTTPLTNHESSTQNSLRTSSKFRLKGKGSGVRDNCDVGGKRVSPSSLHSVNSQDRVLRETDNGRPGSDGESSGSSKTSQSRFSHSTDKTLPKPNSFSGELSKANISSRKRVCTNSPSPTETRKKARVDSPSLSSSRQKSEQVVNGHRKAGKKSQGSGIGLCSSVPAVDNGALSPLLCDNGAIPPQSDVLFDKESTFHHLPQTRLAEGKPTRKVKTTEQLIQDLQRKNSSANVGNSIISKLRTNQIEKDKEEPKLVLPAGVKARARRGKWNTADDSVSVRLTDEMISKNELVERFLETSEPSLSVDVCKISKSCRVAAASPNIELGASTNSCSKDSFDGNSSTNHHSPLGCAPKEENRDVQPALSSALSLEEIYAQLPPVDYNIDWDSVNTYKLPARNPVTGQSNYPVTGDGSPVAGEGNPETREHVDSLHNDRRPDMNGMYDINGDWTTWQQCVTVSSYEGNQLHILPYVDLDN